MRPRFSDFLPIALALLIVPGCRTDSDPVETPLPQLQALDLAKHGAILQHVRQVNLVADLPSFSPQRVDATLLNPWGIAVSPTGIFWISANHAGVSEVFDSAGNIKRSPVTIPTSGGPTGGAPTGVVFNPTAVFKIPSTGEVSRFIFASEDGIISAWASGPAAKVAADRSSSDAVYKGIALARVHHHYFLYATNFKGAKIDVFDENFNYDSTKIFSDPDIPSGFAPFNIANIDGKLFVTYAKQRGPNNEDDESGPGNGFIDIFNARGKLERRFASGGVLNSPWGLAPASEESDGSLLVGNFGDGRINIFSKHGKSVRQLSDSAGTPVTIPGLWALMFRGGRVEHDAGHDRGHHDGIHTPLLYFTAGPNEENDGLFGYLQGVR